ncbi:MAG: FKBP-type peptidyl-prolyl cis-trans isomerase [Chloroflexi bacterium]|nr:FKBP-type peptidyl-prolyl cis-trans isomerase [Chloroflexota bacterium]
MVQARSGDTVRVHYVSRLANGRVLDDSARREPLQFTIGSGRLISAFEEAVVGMRPSETKTVRIPSEGVYGCRQDGLVFKVDRRQMPPTYEPKLGHQIQIHHIDDQAIVARIVEVTDAYVTLDANHPLAGKDIVFDIRLVEVARAA